MPRFNQKGPNNEGPMTGRGIGRCTDFGARGMNRSENQSDNDEQFLVAAWVAEEVLPEVWEEV